MRKVLLQLITILCVLESNAQNIAVTSFELSQSDLTANLEGTRELDQNGEPCALLRLQTTQKGFSFDVGSLGVQKVDDDHVGEVWVYVPSGVRRIDIRHPQLGSLLDYAFPMIIEKARTYVMTLQTATVTTIVQQDDGMTYFSMIVTPATAIVTVDGEMRQLDSDGTLTLRLNQGSHTYEVQAPGYARKSGQFNLGTSKYTETVVLESAQATLSVTCATPGDSIYVNEERKGTGSWTGSLSAGNYKVEARRQGYYSQTQTVTLGEREQRTLDLPALIARVGQLDVNYKPLDSEVWLDGKKLGTSPDVFKQLLIGSHEVEIRKSGYKSEKHSVTIEEGQTFALDGSLNQAQSSVASSGSSGNSGSSTSGAATETFTVNGVTFNMVKVEGGKFRMGEGSNSDRIRAKPAHSVILSSYFIGQTEVTQALWTAVMGSNPSWFKGDNRLPVEQVSWNDCQEFIRKLNALTGKNFRLPTEAEWEFAARGGNQSLGYKYSGGNTIGNVAWYKDNSGGKTHVVATKQANELGIYDMTGNVSEWCSDRYGMYSSKTQTNPAGSGSGEERVYRGGNYLSVMYSSLAEDCRVSNRDRYKPVVTTSAIGLRLALYDEEGQTLALTGSSEQASAASSGSGAATEKFTVNGVAFNMVRVDGGTFTMGATSEQGSDAGKSEKPAHRVTLNSYYIGQTEVTQALWTAVMGSNPSHFKGDNLPVDCVSWDNCQTFISKLNALTGKKFRLPTEAEWEYAARGGSQSQGYKYSGGNDIDKVAWYFVNSGDKTHVVATKQANELGIYDMSGNVSECCSDWFGKYSSNAQTNPTGPKSGKSHIERGGSWFGTWNGMGDYRVSGRNSIVGADRRYTSLGLRLALSE